MPKVSPKKKPVQPVAPKQPEQSAAPPKPDFRGLPVMYDKVEMAEYSTASEKGPLTAADWVDILGWETEPQFKARKVAENPGTKPENWSFGDSGVLNERTGQMHPIHCHNVAGEKVVCWNNGNNRAFKPGWCEELVHTILYGQWAGPHTIPSDFDGLPATVNGETVRISRYGTVISGQHEGTACILADEYLKKDRAEGKDKADAPKYPAWVKHGGVFIEVIVVKGLTEDPRVLMTVDYNAPRTTADVFYTSEVFKSATPPERTELCKVLASAVDLLWTRTGTKGYRTHPEVVGFLDRHKRLLKCVEYIFKTNSAKTFRKLSVLRLQPGQCAALAYLMASSGSDDPEYGDVYRNEEPPSEKHLDWSMWDRMEAFWEGLARGRDFQPVRDVLVRLAASKPADPSNQGLGGDNREKFAVLAAAWERYKSHDGTRPVFDDADREEGGILCLSYSGNDAKGNPLPNGQLALIDVADFNGIDCPPRGHREEDDPPIEYTPEEMARMREEQQARWSAAERDKRRVGG